MGPSYMDLLRGPLLLRVKECSQHRARDRPQALGCRSRGATGAKPGELWRVLRDQEDARKRSLSDADDAAATSRGTPKAWPKARRRAGDGCQ